MLQHKESCRRVYGAACRLHYLQLGEQEKHVEVTKKFTWISYALRMEKVFVENSVRESWKALLHDFHQT